MSHLDTKSSCIYRVWFVVPNASAWTFSINFTDHFNPNQCPHSLHWLSRTPALSWLIFPRTMFQISHEPKVRRILLSGRQKNLFTWHHHFRTLIWLFWWQRIRWELVEKNQVPGLEMNFALLQEHPSHHGSHEKLVWLASWTQMIPEIKTSKMIILPKLQTVFSCLDPFIFSNLLNCLTFWI